MVIMLLGPEFETPCRAGPLSQGNSHTGIVDVRNCLEMEENSRPIVTSEARHTPIRLTSSDPADPNGGPRWQWLIRIPGLCIRA